jgi:hypothetical protein
MQTEVPPQEESRIWVSLEGARPSHLAKVGKMMTVCDSCLR